MTKAICNFFTTLTQVVTPNLFRGLILGYGDPETSSG